MGPLAERSFLVPPTTIYHGGFAELDFKKMCRTKFVRSSIPRALSERIIHQMRTDDEPSIASPFQIPVSPTSFVKVLTSGIVSRTIKAFE